LYIRLSRSHCIVKAAHATIPFQKGFLADFPHFVEKETEKGTEVRMETKKESIKKDRWKEEWKKRKKYGRKKGGN
jgi:hypothetical protein